MSLIRLVTKGGRYLGGSGARAVELHTVNVPEVILTVVDGPSIIRFVADPNPIDAGQPSTLSWEVERAQEVMITDEGGGQVVRTTELTGTST